MILLLVEDSKFIYGSISHERNRPIVNSSANISGFKGSTTVEGIAYRFPSVKILGPILGKKKWKSKYYNILEEKVEIGD